MALKRFLEEEKIGARQFSKTPLFSIRFSRELGI